VKVAWRGGGRVRGVVTEGPGGKPVAGARVDFWRKGLKLPEGTPYPRYATTAAGGTFQALLPPGPWHLLVNGPEALYVYRTIPAAPLSDEPEQPGGTDGAKAPERQFYPDAWVAVDLKADGPAPEVKVNLTRAPVLRGQVVGPDGKPAAGVRLVRRTAHV